MRKSLTDRQHEGRKIRVATEDDLSEVRRWLELDNEALEEGSFIGNFAQIESGQREGHLFVMIEAGSDLPVGLCLGDENIIILAVCRASRGVGVGRAMVEWFIERARQRDFIGLDGECAPRSSMKFWKHLGFLTVPDPSCAPIGAWMPSNSPVGPERGSSRRPWVAMPLVHNREPPAGAPLVRVRFEPTEGILYAHGSNAFETDAEVLDDGEMLLTRDFVAYAPTMDRRFRVFVDDTVVEEDKLKYLRTPDVERSSSMQWVRVRWLHPDS